MFRGRIFRYNSGPAQNTAFRLDETQNFTSRLDETTGFGRCVPSVLEGCLTENHFENFFRLRYLSRSSILAQATEGTFRRSNNEICTAELHVPQF